MPSWLHRATQSIDAVSDTTGDILFEIPVSGDTLRVLEGRRAGPNGIIYAGITTSFNSDSVSGELLEYSLSGKPLGSIQLPNDPAESDYYYPYGFAVASRRLLLGRPAQQRQRRSRQPHAAA